MLYVIKLLINKGLSMSKKINFKFDDSAIKTGRKNISVRVVGERVDPQHMTHKEYIHYLCYLFDFKIGKGWDGIEKNSYQFNWTPEPRHNIQTREQALKFLGISNLKNSSGVEKRTNQRRVNQKDYRHDKLDRRALRQRRQEEKLNNLVYYITIGFLILLVLMWVFADVIYLMEIKNG